MARGATGVRNGTHIRTPDDAIEGQLDGSGQADAGRDDPAERLARAADQFAASRDVDQLLDRLATEAIRLTGADGGNAQLLNHGGQRAQRCLRTRSRQSMSATITSDGNAVAVVEVYTYARGFDTHDRHLLTCLARIAAPTLLRTLDLHHAQDEATRRAGQRGHTTARRPVRADVRPARSAREVDRAVATTVHDLRTPLAALDGYVWLLRSEQPPADTELVGSIQRQITRLRTLVDDLQVAVCSDRPAVSANPSSVDVGSLARQAAHDLHAAMPDTDVVVHAGPTASALVDPGHLERMLINLLTNAVRYGRPPVEIRTGQRPGRVTVTVTDAGPGVPPSFVPHLFERFTRGPGAADEPDGTGLGLAIVRSLAAANDATIRYRPNQPHGASFEIDLPAAPPD